MKKILSLLICLALLCGAASAASTMPQYTPDTEMGKLGDTIHFDFSGGNVWYSDTPFVLEEEPEGIIATLNIKYLEGFSRYMPEWSDERGVERTATIEFVSAATGETIFKYNYADVNIAYLPRAAVKEPFYLKLTDPTLNGEPNPQMSGDLRLGTAWIINKKIPPAGAITREDFVLLLSDFVDLPITIHEIFSDMSPNYPYFSEIGKLYAAGVVKGKTDGQFGLDDPITNAEAANMIARALSDDPDSVEYPLGGLEFCLNNNICDGVGTFNPDDYASWGAVEKMLDNVREKFPRQ